jgi:L-ascorbate metabolism protein UlaG (beta-lactamase superfamily)
MAVGAGLDWFGCATFRLTVGETVVFLDAYIDRAPGAAGPGVRADDVERADWILVGHSHFDHLYGADRIALRTGATIVGSYETVRVMSAAGVPDAQLLPVAGGERVRLAGDLTVRVFPSLHSCVWSARPFPAADEVCLGDLDVVYQERLAGAVHFAGAIAAGLPVESPVARHLRESDQRARGDGGALLYLLETPTGTLLYQDSFGYWQGVLASLRPDVAILAAAGRVNVDGEPGQGSLAQFVAAQAAVLAPRRLILCHHDAWLSDLLPPTDIEPIRTELARQAPGTSLVELGYVDGYRLF